MYQFSAEKKETSRLWESESLVSLSTSSSILLWVNSQYFIQPIGWKSSFLSLDMNLAHLANDGDNRGWEQLLVQKVQCLQNCLNDDRSDDDDGDVDVDHDGNSGDVKT